LLLTNAIKARILKQIKTKYGRHQGSISSKLYEQLSYTQIPKAQKRIKLPVFFEILGYACTKAVCRTLMKLTLGIVKF
jgi:hypothetical protein